MDIVYIKRFKRMSNASFIHKKEKRFREEIKTIIMIIYIYSLSDCKYSVQPNRVFMKNTQPSTDLSSFTN